MTVHTSTLLSFEALGRQRHVRRLHADARHTNFSTHGASSADVGVGLRGVQDGMIDQLDDGIGHGFDTVHHRGAERHRESDIVDGIGLLYRIGGRDKLLPHSRSVHAKCLRMLSVDHLMVNSLLPSQRAVAAAVPVLWGEPGRRRPRGGRIRRPQCCGR